MKKNDPRTAPAAPRSPGDLNPRAEPVLDFPDRGLGELTAQDYERLGFLCGLEVHQQLDTRSKLFCRCPAGHRATTCDAEVLRHMRPTLSELGEYDGTALMEFKTRKEIVYQLERSSVCTYEIDDTPPFDIDPEAVEIAIEVALLCGLDLVNELHVMRKQYLDGSIPTGFQRTAMVGMTGAIPFRVPELGVDRELRIRQLSLEEDSCREISDVGHRITFTTDRLGTPLTEMVTEPELYTPFEVPAAGGLLARVARATGKVRRGPGAARQDVNVSVAGGRRVEIKGVDNQRNLPLLVHIEAYRQLNLLRVREELHRRGVTHAMLALPDEGLPWEQSDLVVLAGRGLRHSDFAPLRDALSAGQTICALRLPGFGGLLSRRTQPGVTFAGELADRARVIGCLPSRPFLLHSELTDYGLGSARWRSLAHRLRSGSEDTIVVIWGPEEDVATAAREIFARAREALDGVPAETRQAFPDGTNGFERILPGPDRMYPDTDTPPLPIADETVARIRGNLPLQPWQRIDRYTGEKQLDAAVAARLAAAPWAGLFDELDPPPGAVARRVAFALEKRLPHHRRSCRMASLPEASRLQPIVDTLATGKMRHEGFEPALDRLIREPDVPPAEVAASHSGGPSDEDELTTEIGRVQQSAEALAGKPPEVVLRWAMGRIMPRFLGRIAPVRVRAALSGALLGAAEEERA